MKTFDRAMRELDHLRRQFVDLYARSLEDRGPKYPKLDEHWHEFEQLTATVRRWQAALGLPQLADTD